MDYTYDILIASFVRPVELKLCLASIKNQIEANFQKVWILTLNNDSKTKDVVSGAGLSDFEIVTVTEMPPPGKSRNILIEKSNADFMLFLDDDIVLQNNYMAEGEKVLMAQEFDIFGGSDSIIEYSSFKQEILAYILSSYFVMGPTAVRHRKRQTISDASEVHLTLCNLWIRSRLFENTKFDEHIKRCEENILIDNMQNLGAKVGYVSELNVKHKRREELIEQARIQYMSGYNRGLSFYKKNVTFKLFFLIPIMVGIIILLSPFIDSQIILLLFIIHTLFSVAVGINSFLKTNNIIALPLSWIYIITIHVCFSLGIILGVLKGAKGKFFEA